MTQTAPIYLDHNATSPIDPLVAQAITDCYAKGFCNPVSQHQFGQTARRVLEKSRSTILQMLGGVSKGMATDSLIFTSGGTESNNLALIGLTSAAFEKIVSGNSQAKPGDFQVLISSIEHPSIMGAGEQLARLGFAVRKIDANPQGTVRLDHLNELLQQPTLLVSLMMANNETGVIQPVREAAERCHRHNVSIHVDAVQAVGKIPVHFRELHIDAMTFTAHKFCGPRGIGALILKQGVSIEPILYGGFQQKGMRPGTEDVALVVGMEAAVRLSIDQPERSEKIRSLRDWLQNALTTEFPGIYVVGGEVERLPNTLNIAIPGINRQAFLMAADLAGIAISTGSACASGSSELSPVLEAMGLEKRLIESSIRISLGITNSLAEIENGCCHISSILRHLQQHPTRGIS